MEFTTLTIIVQLIFLEGILSIDNAAVLGAMVNHLPNDKPIPWPRRLAHLHAWGDRVLGNQRDAALPPIRSSLVRHARTWPPSGASLENLG